MQIRKGVTLTDNQAAVYDALLTYGPLPDHALVPIVQHVERAHQSSSGIRTRRAELWNKGLVRRTHQTVKMPSGRSATFHKAVA